MLNSALENFILFNTIFALVGFFIAYLLINFTTRKLPQIQPYVLSQIYTLLLTIPPLISAWLVIASLLPEAFMDKSAFKAAHSLPIHKLHLLGDVIGTLEPTFTYLTMLFIVAIALFMIISTLRSYTRINNLVKQFEVSATQPSVEQLSLVQEVAARYKMQVGLVMSPYPFSFVWGFIHSKLLLSSGLLCNLTPAELTGVIEHEVTHHLRRDNLIKLLLNICCYSSLAFPLSRLILKWRAIEVEMICDEVAAARTLAPLEIAEALLKLKRQKFPSDNNKLVKLSSSAFIPDESESFERRIKRLIDFADVIPQFKQISTMSSLRKDIIFFVAASFTITLLLSTLIYPLAVHDATETFIHFIK